MADKAKTEKRIPDNEPKTGVCVKETGNGPKNSTNRFGEEPSFEQMQDDLTGLYDD